MSGPQTKTFIVTRFDPDRDVEPRTQAYEVPCQPDWKILDALNYIKDQLDPTLSHRWSCRMAVCGSCGMNVDGKPTLTCKQPVDAYGDQVEVEPLSNFSLRAPPSTALKPTARPRCTGPSTVSTKSLSKRCSAAVRRPMSPTRMAQALSPKLFAWLTCGSSTCFSTPAPIRTAAIRTARPR